RRLENEYKQSKETRKRQRYAPAKGKRAEDGAERRKRLPDSKPRAKPAKSATGRESLSPTAMRTGDNQRDGAMPPDSNYTLIDRNILGADVQVLFQSVLSQLADQRNAVSSAAASASTSAPSTLAVDAVGATERGEPAPNGRTISHDVTNGDMRTPSPADHAAETSLPPMVSIRSEDLGRSAPMYRGQTGKDRRQHGLFARGQIEGGRFICEYKGQVVLKAAYKEDPKNYYELLRTTRPYSQFHQEIDLCIDARRQGSEARFVRRSCAANVVLRSMYVVGGGDALIHLGLFAARDIEADEELTAGWEWDDGELPAVASMAPDDAEDYLGRPEGRRMSKVWRQVFGGMACACPDTDCQVRRLFAMLGVEESVAREDPAGALKRRASRPNKISMSEDADMDGSPPPARSPDGSGSLHGTHSRKGSGAGVHDSPGSPLAARGSAGDAAHSSRATLSVSTGRLPANTGTQRQSSADSPRAAAQLRQPGDEGGYQRGANGQGGPRSRKRKPSAHLDGLGNGHNATISASTSDCESTGSKKPRSVSGSSASRRGPGSSELPQKKLWISRYLERVERETGDSNGATTELVSLMEVEAEPREAEPNKTQAEPNKPQAEPNKAQAEPNKIQAEVKEVIVAGTTPVPEEKPASPKAAGEDRAFVKSAPTDANAPTPSPSMSPSLAGGAVIAESTESSAIPAVKEAPAQQPQPASEPKPKVEPKAEPKAEPDAEPDAEPRRESAVTSPTKSPAAEAPAKKQRLSLAEYNKRRRGHTTASTAKETESKSAAASDQPQLKPDATLAATSEGGSPVSEKGAKPAAEKSTNHVAEKSTNAAAEKSVKPAAEKSVKPAAEKSVTLAADTAPQPAPAPEQNGARPPVPASPMAMMPKAGDPLGRRGMISPPPPPPPPMPQPGAGAGAARADDRPIGGRDHGHRFERGAAYVPPHRPRDRARDGNGEHESGEISQRRNFRVRSQSRERGGRERRYNTFSGPQPAPPRSTSEWRSGSYTAGVAGMRALSMSPVQHPHGSGSAPGPPPPPAAGDGGPHRNAVRRMGSRGGSPPRR
ncbi:SET domain-containing protein 3, partial [Coemansia erecta]